MDLEELAAFFHPSYPGQVVLLGVGNRLRGDDAAGCELVTALEQHWKARHNSLASNFQVNIVFIDAGECPEDWFIRITDLEPQVIIVCDAVDLQAEPGTVALLEAEELPEGLCFSTHRLPLRSLLTLWKENGSQTAVLALQPEALGFGQGLSSSVRRSIDHLIHLIIG